MKDVSWDSNSHSENVTTSACLFLQLHEYVSVYVENRTCLEISNMWWNWCSGVWCGVYVRWAVVLRYASCPNRQPAKAALRHPFEGPVYFPLVSQDSSTSVMKEAFVFAVFLPNPGATPSQLNKRHSVANAEAQLKLEMKLEAADWLTSITQTPEAITFMQKSLRPWVLFKLCIRILCKDKSKIIFLPQTGGFKLFALSQSHFFCKIWTPAFALKQGRCSPSQQSQKNREKNWINPRFQTQQPRGSRAPQSTTTQPKKNGGEKRLHVTLKRNICHFRGLHPVSH